MFKEVVVIVIMAICKERIKGEDFTLTTDAFSSIMSINDDFKLFVWESALLCISKRENEKRFDKDAVNEYLIINYCFKFHKVG